MHSARISTIAAIGRNRELGKKGQLLWPIKVDLARVKALTMGHPIIMGKNTYRSIGRPLPGRTNIVLSWEPEEIEGCVVHTSLKDALAYARTIDSEEIFIFGGASVYAAGLPATDRIYLTRIDAEDADADAFFPEYETIFTKEIEREEHPEHTPPYTWITLDRA